MAPSLDVLALAARRRERFYDALEGGLALLFGSDEVRFGHDISYRYRPDPDLYYLTGFPEAEAVGVFDAARRRMTLFVRPRDRTRETWEGRRAGPAGAKKDYGAAEAHSIGELAEMLPEMIREAAVLYHAFGQRGEADRLVADALGRFRREARNPKRGPTVVKDPTEILHEMRLFKEPEEMDALAASCAVAAKAHREAMAAVSPGRFEYELEAVIERRFKEEGATVPAYPTIVAAGENATILHYTENRSRIGKDDLVLVDAGCQLGGYASDITRTFPASGRFTPKQRRVYEVVLAAEKAAIATVRPGARVEDVHRAAQDVLLDGLLSVGLLTGERKRLAARKAQERFTLHKTSHWIGLDVHDRGRYVAKDGGSRALEPGMALTVEPGIYVRPDERNVADGYLGIGVRIEDDVVVTADGCRVLTAGAPREVEEVEAAVRSRSR